MGGGARPPRLGRRLRPAHQARRAGLSAQMDLAGRSLKGQLSHAELDRRALCGDRGRSRTVLKDMQQGRQEPMAIDAVVHAVRARPARPLGGDRWSTRCCAAARSRGLVQGAPPVQLSSANCRKGWRCSRSPARTRSHWWYSCSPRPPGSSRFGHHSRAPAPAAAPRLLLGVERLLPAGLAARAAPPPARSTRLGPRRRRPDQGHRQGPRRRRHLRKQRSPARRKIGPGDLDDPRRKRLVGHRQRIHGPSGTSANDDHARGAPRTHARRPPSTRAPRRTTATTSTRTATTTHVRRPPSTPATTHEARIDAVGAPSQRSSATAEARRQASQRRRKAVERPAGEVAAELHRARSRWCCSGTRPDPTTEPSAARSTPSQRSAATASTCSKAAPSEVASYGAITRQMPVYGTPTILIIGPHRTDSLTGLQDDLLDRTGDQEVRAG